MVGVPHLRSGGYPIQVWMVGGYPIPGQGVPHPRGVPYLAGTPAGSGYPILGRGYPRYPPTLRPGWGTPLRWGTPHHQYLAGVPSTLGWGTPPDLGWGTPLRQSSIASTCYAVGGMPLALTQEDFLVLLP